MNWLFTLQYLAIGVAWPKAVKMCLQLILLAEKNIVINNSEVLFVAKWLFAMVAKTARNWPITKTSYGCGCSILYDYITDHKSQIYTI